MNPTQDIPQGSAPASPEPPASQPGSGISSPPAQAQTGLKPAAPGVPADLSNLAIGAGILLTAFLIFWMGLYLPNHVALRTLIASFGTFALVWVLYRLRIFHRPHGGLIVAGAVGLFAAALPFIERGFQKLDSAAKSGLAGDPVKPAAEIPEGLPVPTRQSLPVPPVPAPPQDDTVHELNAPEPNPSVGKIILVKQEARVLISGKKYLIRAGSKFPFKKLEDGMVTFQAGDQEVTIDMELVSFVGQSMEKPEDITRLAKAELMRRYPPIGVKDSPENETFVARIKELQVEMPELFKNPRWPLEIGEQLAAQEGWQRAGASPEEREPLPPAPPADAPLDAPLDVPLDAAKIPPPPVPSDIPQEAPK